MYTREWASLFPQNLASRCIATNCIHYNTNCIYYNIYYCPCYKMQSHAAHVRIFEFNSLVWVVKRCKRKRKFLQFICVPHNSLDVITLFATVLRDVMFCYANFVAPASVFVVIRGYFCLRPRAPTNLDVVLWKKLYFCKNT